MNLHLFFDVYIEDAPLGVYLRGDRRRFEIDHRIRTAAPAYGFQTKFDITRYTLDSYVDIPWSSATIRIECGNPEYEGIYSDLALKFPAASIVRHRSDTAEKYFDALNQLPLSGNSWIFFSPNNDHPFLNHHDQLAHVLTDADNAAVRTGADVVSIPYSHFTESMNTFRPTHHDWGIYGGVFPKFLYETEHSYVIQSNKLLLDSLHIYRLDDLKWMFGQSRNTGRVIRPEDTEFYLTDAKSHVMVLPKFEFCRHYDGYSHIADKVPPLFIPPGYFEKIFVSVMATRNPVKAISILILQLLILAFRMLTEQILKYCGTISLAFGKTEFLRSISIRTMWIPRAINSAITWTFKTLGAVRPRLWSCCDR